MKKLNAAGRYLLLALTGLVLGVNLYLWNAQSLVGTAMPMPFGYGAAVVLSGSMEPTFSEGDLILVKQADVFATNDIVVYENGGILVVHRIIGIDGDTITTQGDANNAPDHPIPSAAIKGRVLGWIPKIGTVVKFLKTPAGTLCILAAAFALMEIPRRREQEKDEAERQKIIDEINRLKNEE